ncbi:MAG TPA: DNA topoisomerase VI subunit B [Myxococcaceae bacterium]|nr:DNA topoisomerase VI subunit B [Myxococcaceae bacterium]
MAAKALKNKVKPVAKAKPAKQLSLLSAERSAPPPKSVKLKAVEAPPPPPPELESAPEPPKRRATAEQMASKQREISISEFFTKNRHLLGFDSPSKALLTAVKEAVDNSLDACEEAGILPDVTVEIKEAGPDRFVMAVEDNGPGIVKAQIPKIFGKLLYGSKFHRLKQSRGQQGIGISAAAMYGQLTTGKPIVVTSKTGKGRAAHHFEIQIDTRKNAPVVAKDDELEIPKDHGTRVEIEMEADYRNGKRWLLRYLEQTALANPHCRLEYRRPDEEALVFPRVAETPPREAVEIKPHPHGVELGQLILKLKETSARDVRGCLMHEFSRVSPTVAAEILKAARIHGGTKPKVVANDVKMAEALHRAIQATKIMSPPTNCLSPIGEELIHKGLVSFLAVTQELAQAEEQEQLELQAQAGRGKRKEEAAKRLEEIKQRLTQSAQEPKEEGEEIVAGHKFFITSVTRPPRVYRGNPFQIEVGLAYGGPLPGDRPVELYRFANRVPLLFQRGACGVTEAVLRTDWRNYELSQPKGSLPVGPMILFVHIASVWVPFTSESKEAVAHYPEILGEIRLAAQECGRRLAAFVRRRKSAEYELQRRSIFELYIDEIAGSMKKLIGVDPARVKQDFGKLANKITGGGMTDAVLKQASEKIAKRPRTAEREMEG